MAKHWRSIEGWFDFDDIYELALRRVGAAPARFVEVGAYLGRSTCYMAERIGELELDVSFHVVDTFEGDRHVGSHDLWPDFCANLERAGVLSRVVAHRGLSVDMAAGFEDGALDFVFIDAGHSAEDVAADLAAWWPKLRPGGLLAGHDYTNFDGVRMAVDAFVAAQGLGHAFRSVRSSWMLYRSIKVDAAYCINLVRRPDRRAQVAQQFVAAGLEVSFFDAVDGSILDHSGAMSDGQAGCTMSHLALLRTAAAAGQRHILVFEDDVELVDGFGTKLATALARCPAHYGLFYVGALCVAAWGGYLHPFDDGLAKVGCVAGTHAYVVNLDRLPAIEAGLAELQSVVDHWYAAHLHRAGDCFVCTPYLAFQTAGYSDVAGHANDNGAHREVVWA